MNGAPPHCVLSPQKCVHHSGIRRTETTPKIVKFHVIANLYRNTTHHTPQQFPPSQRCTCYTRAMLMVGRGSGCAGQKYCFCDYVFAPINGLYTPFPARARSVRPIGIPLYMCSHQSTVNTAVIDISNIYIMS